MPRLLIVTWPYALLFWGVFLWAFLPEGRIISRKSEPFAGAQDAGSKRFIAVGQGLGMSTAFVAAAKLPAAALPHRVWLFFAGVAAIIGGSLLRRHCWRMLGASFTGSVIVKPDQMVVERGAYRYVRHPSYTGGGILFLGVGLALGNWVSLLALMTAVFVVYSYRVTIEERALAGIIGGPYSAYQRRTKRFVPYLF